MNTQSLSIIIGVLSVGIIITFLVLIYLDYSNYKKLTENSVFPPWPAKCPDYWEIEAGAEHDGQGDIITKCRNINKIGDCMNGDGNNSIMDFSEPIFKGTQGQLYKCSWAKKCKAPWEGIDTIC